MCIGKCWMEATNYDSERVIIVVITMTMTTMDSGFIVRCFANIYFVNGMTLFHLHTNNTIFKCFNSNSTFFCRRKYARIFDKYFELCIFFNIVHLLCKVFFVSLVSHLKRDSLLFVIHACQMPQNWFISSCKYIRETFPLHAALVLVVHFH